MFAILRSATSKQVQLILQPWRLRELPPYVLKRGPWTIVARGDEARLRLHYRRALAREGYCIVDAKARLFSPDEVGQSVH
jgi:hypothetical protein